MGLLWKMVDVALRFFALGLFVSTLLNWMLSTPSKGFRKRMSDFYNLFLNPIRRCIKPVKLSPSAPAGIDLSPIVLLLFVWLGVHPFLKWIFGG